MKRICRQKMFLVMVASVCLSAAFTCTVRAQEEAEEVVVTEINQLMTAKEEVDVKEKPLDGAEVIHSYQSGESILVSGKTEDGWYQVVYQGKRGYVPVSSVISSSDIDTAQLDRELEEVQNESKIMVEEVERYREESKRSKIWGAVIVLLVIGIFATGIISTIKSEKEKGEEEECEEEKSE